MIDPCLPGGPYLFDESQKWSTMTAARLSAAQKSKFYKEGQNYRAIALPVYAEGHPDFAKGDGWTHGVARRDNLWARIGFKDRVPFDLTYRDRF